MTAEKRLVNNALYDELGDRWYLADDDPVALLRAETKAKRLWLLEKLRPRLEARGRSIADTTVLDVGCGGGFLSNALALDGFQVTGLDCSASSLSVARKFDQTSKVDYVQADALNLPFLDNSFDVVTCMDFLEHVERPDVAIREIARVLKPGGQFFFHTFNRNLLSWLVIIKMVEWFVVNTPKNMHVLRLFLKPSEVEQMCRQEGLSVREWMGLRPDFSSIPLKNYWTGVVPKTLRFQTTSSLKLSYMGLAESV